MATPGSITIVRYDLAHFGIVASVLSPTVFEVNGLVGFGVGAFIGNSLFVSRKATGTGLAPQGETQVITGYVNSTGQITIAAGFTVAISVGDEILVTPVSIASIPAILALVDKKVAGKVQVFQKHITSAANAGDITVATITAQDCDIKALNVRSNGATTADLTSISVFGGTGKVITFIAAVDGVRANIAAAAQQLSWQTNGGVVTLPATHTIVITLAGTGATAVDLTITIEYVAVTDGGYLA